MLTPTRPLTPTFRLAVVAIALAGSTMRSSEPKLYIGSKFHYELKLLDAWHVSVQDSGVVVLFNYEPREGGPQGFFPEHGAEIYVIPFVRDAVYRLRLLCWKGDSQSSRYRSGLQSVLRGMKARNRRGPASTLLRGPRQIAR